MAEYQEDELASDSEDEKKIEKAEKAAKRKASKWRKRKADSVAGLSKAKFRRDQQFLGLQEAFGGRLPSIRGRIPGSVGPFRVGPCHNCWEMGHFRRDCLKPVQALPRPACPPGPAGKAKWYSFVMSSESVQRELVSNELISDSVAHYSVNVFDACQAVCASEVSLLDPTREILQERAWESQGLEGPSPRIKGRLRHHVSFWVDHLRMPNVM